MEEWKNNYAYVGPFSKESGLAAACQRDGKWLHVDSDGIPAYGARYRMVGPFSGGLAWVQHENGQFSYIHLDGSLAFGEKFDLATSFSQGLASVRQGIAYFRISPLGERVIQQTI